MATVEFNHFQPPCKSLLRRHRVTFILSVLLQLSHTYLFVSSDENSVESRVHSVI